MGVLECTRLGCGRIMCEKMHCFGNYICDDCADEFIQLMKKLGRKKATYEFYNKKIKKFLKTKKVYNNDSPGSNDYSSDDELVHIDDYF